MKFCFSVFQQSNLNELFFTINSIVSRSAISSPFKINENINILFIYISIRGEDKDSNYQSITDLKHHPASTLRDTHETHPDVMPVWQNAKS